MTFTRPEALLLLPFLVGLLALALSRQTERLRRLGDGFGGPRAAPRLTTRELFRFPRRRMYALLGLAVTLTLAASGARFGSGVSLNPTQPLDVVVAIDVSMSMTATDVAPSRIARAKQLVYSLSETLPLERLGLVVFADWPFALVPVTNDHSLIEFFTDSLAVDFLNERDQGTRLSAAMLEARQQLDARQEEGRVQVILLVTDGDAHEDQLAVTDTAAIAGDDDVSIWVAGIGTRDGALLAGSPDGPPIADEDGNPVVATLNEDLLRRIGAAGNGGYVNVSADRGLRDLLGHFRRVREGEGDAAGLTDIATWLMLLSVGLLLLDGILDAGGKVLRRAQRREALDSGVYP